MICWYIRAQICPSSSSESQWNIIGFDDPLCQLMANRSEEIGSTKQNATNFFQYGCWPFCSIIFRLNVFRQITPHFFTAVISSFEFISLSHDFNNPLLWRTTPHSPAKSIRLPTFSIPIAKPQSSAHTHKYTFKRVSHTTTRNLLIFITLSYILLMKQITRGNKTNVMHISVRVTLVSVPFPLFGGSL